MDCVNPAPSPSSCSAKPLPHYETLDPNTKQTLPEAFHPINSVSYSPASSWRMGAHFRITTFKKSPRSTWCCVSVVARCERAARHGVRGMRSISASHLYSNTFVDSLFGLPYVPAVDSLSYTETLTRIALANASPGAKESSSSSAAAAASSSVLSSSVARAFH